MQNACTFEESGHYCVAHGLRDDGRPDSEEPIVSSIPHERMSAGAQKEEDIYDLRHVRMRQVMVRSPSGVERYKYIFFSSSHGRHGKKPRRHNRITIRRV